VKREALCAFPKVDEARPKMVRARGDHVARADLAKSISRFCVRLRRFYMQLPLFFCAKVAKMIHS
jgi:hypothetical protein